MLKSIRIHGSYHTGGGCWVDHVLISTGIRNPWQWLLVSVTDESIRIDLLDRTSNNRYESFDYGGDGMSWMVTDGDQKMFYDLIEEHWASDLGIYPDRSVSIWRNIDTDSQTEPVWVDDGWSLYHQVNWDDGETGDGYHFLKSATIEPLEYFGDQLVLTFANGHTEKFTGQEIVDGLSEAFLSAANWFNKDAQETTERD
tara:strand:+ start:1615 stop:2211 length:597 start_codon:yes stop_codon:yes gene_type:complete